MIDQVKRIKNLIKQDEDALDDVLEEKKLSEVTGGGTQFNERNQIEYCELEVLITGNLDEAKKVITETLEDQGLSKGSKIILADEEILIGNHDVLALHFNNIWRFARLPSKSRRQ